MSENTPDTAMDTSDMSTDMTNGDTEPSMEDILASIRQIIADDQTDDLVAFDDVPDAAPTSLDIVSDSTFISEPAIAQSSGIALEIVADLPDAPLAPSTPLSNVVEEDTDILDLINFVDESIGDSEDNEGLTAQTDVPKGIASESFDEFEDLIVSPPSAPVTDAPSVPATQSVAEIENVVSETIPETKAVVFDEALDLIVSADATDYVTTSLSSELPDIAEETSLEDMFEDLAAEPIGAVTDTVSQVAIPEVQDDEFEDLVPEVDDLAIPEITGKATSFENVVESAPKVETSLDNTDLDGMDLVFVEPDDPNFPSVFKTDTDSIETAPVFEATLSSKDIADDDIMTTPASAENVMRGTPDEDMDLVKSLLADLMDEPAADTPDLIVSEPVTPLVEPDSDFLDDAFLSDDEDDVSETDEVLEGDILDETSILDDVLEKSIEQEVAIHLEMEAAQPEPQTAPTSVSDIEERPADLELVSSDDDDSLSAIAAEAEKLSALRLLVQEDEVEDVTPNTDTVSLEAVDVESKLSLVSKTGAGLAVVGAGAVAFLNAKSDQSADEVDTLSPDVEVVIETAQETPEEIDQLGDDHQNSKLDIPSPNTSEETETMAQAAKPDTIIDEGTHRGSSDAFASLTSAVKEKAEMEERGPAIGDLVQDALRPMLKEWLDKNLKGIVERAVAKEVKRISSGK